MVDSAVAICERISDQSRSFDYFGKLVRLCCQGRGNNTLLDRRGNNNKMHMCLVLGQYLGGSQSYQLAALTSESLPLLPIIEEGILTAV